MAICKGYEEVDKARWQEEEQMETDGKGMKVRLSAVVGDNRRVKVISPSTTHIHIHLHFHSLHHFDIRCIPARSSAPRRAMPDDPIPPKGTTNPLFGATPAPDPDVDAETSSPPAAEPSQSPSSSPPPEGTGNPLFGATPEQDGKAEEGGVGDAAAVKQSVKGRVEATSRERVRDLRAAREAALGTSSSVSDPWTCRISDCVLDHLCVSDCLIVPHDDISAPTNPVPTIIRSDALPVVFPPRLPPQTGIPPLPPPRDISSSRRRVVVLPPPAPPR
jgi:hypothetical protein